MTQKYCRGCGVSLQTNAPDKPGFIPAELLESKSSNSFICKRCYRIIHYGESGTILPSAPEVLKSINKAVALSDLLVIIADFSDLTGTLPVWSDLLNDQSYLLAINKIDLLPTRAKLNEIIHYLKDYLTKLNWSKPLDLVLVSSAKGMGIDVLIKSISGAVSPGAKIAFIGAANVGKSSLIKRIMATEDSAQTPTVSKFPGTTIGLSNWSVFKGRNTLIDTPGRISGDRLVDRLCPDCASVLLPVAEIGQKLWSLKPGKGLILGGVFAIENHGDAEAVLIVFGSPHVSFHRTENVKINELLTVSPDWLSKICKKCLPKLNWREETLILEPNQDLAVAGLGWMSLRGIKTTFKITFPRGVSWEIRPALIGKRE